MRIFEINESAPDLERKELKRVERIGKFILRNCSQFLEETQGLAFSMYRGMNLNEFDKKPTVFKSTILKTRLPKDSSLELQDLTDEYLKNKGFTAVRGNSIFCTGSKGRAEGYGIVYSILPLNGYSYTWSERTYDFYNKYGRTQTIFKMTTLENKYTWQEFREFYVKETNNENYETKDLENFMGKYIDKDKLSAILDNDQFRNTNLKAAMISQHEIMITGPGYVAIDSASPILHKIRTQLSIV